MYLLQGQWDDALKYCQRIIDAGQAGAELDRVEEMAAAARNKSLSPQLREQISPPSRWASEAQRGWTALNAGDPATAQSLFQMALEEHPGDAAALNGLGWAQLRGGQLQQAGESFQKVPDGDPNAAAALNGLALVDRQQGELDQAIGLWERMVKRWPGINAGTYGLADAYIAKGEADKAIPLSEQILKANPQDQATRAKLEQARSQSGR